MTMTEQQTMFGAPPAADTAEYWLCKRCGFPFRDDTKEKPCPKCAAGNDHIVSLDAHEVAPLLDKYNRKKVALKTTTTTPTTTPARRLRVSLGLLGLAFGLAFWLDAARFTLAGAVAFTNWIAERINVPLTIPMPSAWPWFVALICSVALGLIFKYVEIDFAPWRLPDSADIFRLAAWRLSREWDVWIVWILAIIVDVGAVYGGMKAEAAGESVVFLRQAISSSAGAAFIAIIITILPDRLIRASWRRIMK